MKNENENENKPNTYGEKVEVLKMVLNGRLTTPNLNTFQKTLSSLNTENKTTLSTMFLKNLITTADKKKKRNVIYNILKKGDFKTESRHRYFKEFDQFGNTIKTKETLKFLVA